MNDGPALRRIRKMLIPSGAYMGTTVADLEASSNEPWTVLMRLKGDENKVLRDYAKMLKAKSQWEDDFMLKHKDDKELAKTEYNIVPKNAVLQLYPKPKPPELSTAAQATVAGPVVHLIASPQGPKFIVLKLLKVVSWFVEADVADENLVWVMTWMVKWLALFVLFTVCKHPGLLLDFGVKAFWTTWNHPQLNQAADSVAEKLKSENSMEDEPHFPRHVVQYQLDWTFALAPCALAAYIFKTLHST